MKNKNKKIVILAGGWTSEAQISRGTADFCSSAAQNAGWNVKLIEFNQNVFDELKKIKPSRVLNALHGKIGEDGSIQGLLNIMQIPYTHSGVLASSIAMDKIASRYFFNAIGIKMPLLLNFEKTKSLKPKNFNGKYVIKPTNNGSSVGVKIITKKSLPPNRNEWPENCTLMAEEFIDGKELTVGIFDGRALCVTEIRSSMYFYNYEAKYSEGKSKHIFPADIPKHISKLAMTWAEDAFQILGCRGIARADFRWDTQKDKLFMLEINTQPGMTKTSLLPEQARYCGISDEKLINHLLENARCD